MPHWLQGGQRAGTVTGAAARPYRKGSVLVDWLSSTGHKVIGHLYLITSFGFFMIAGLMAMIMRAQLMGPDNHLVSDQQYNELFTMHGAIMLLLFATPLFVAEVPDRRADADDGRVGDQATMAAPP